MEHNHEHMPERGVLKHWEKVQSLLTYGGWNRENRGDLSLSNLYQSSKCHQWRSQELTCEHDDFETIGHFPENMEIEDEYMTNKIKCVECGKIGTEYYEFVERKFQED